MKKSGDQKTPELPHFQRHTIYQGSPAERPTCLVGDINADGVPEVVIATRNPQQQLHWFGRTPTGTWARHLIDDTVDSLGVGGVLVDLTGNGRLDLIAGDDARSNGVYWWECPEDPTQRWRRRELCRMPANRTHDLLVADIDGDGRSELYFWNEFSKNIFWAPIPDDPTVSPWPNVRPLATDVADQGLAVADLDGDGRLELLAGLWWYRLSSNGKWEGHVFTTEFAAPRLATADFDGDGRLEIALCESDGGGKRKTFGRLALLRAGADPEGLWEAEVLHDQLLNPHSLQVADFDGDGRPDIYVGDMGLKAWNEPHLPAQRIFLNRGERMEEHIIDQGVGTHEAQLIELDGHVGIVGKPFRALDVAPPRPPDVDAVHLWLPDR